MQTNRVVQEHHQKQILN